MTEINQALLKAHEEKEQGLAKDDPLEVRGLTKKNLPLTTRPDSFLKLLGILEELGNTHVLAAARIRAAYKYRAIKGTAKTSKFNDIPKGTVEDAWVISADLSKLYDKWNAVVPIRKRGALIDVLCNGKSFNYIAIEKQRSWTTIKRWSVSAVQEWVKLDVGLNTGKREVIHAEHKARFDRPPIIAPTKIVIYEEE